MSQIAIRARYAVRYGAALFTVLLAAILPGPAVAQADRTVTKEELALLPPYCKDTYIFNPRTNETQPPPEAQRWVRVMGRGFFTMHHYCFGLNHMARANKHGIKKQFRDNNLTYAINNFNFVLNNAPDDFIMLPEVLVKKGEALTKLRRDREAVETFQRSFRTKADYWPAYVGLADLLRRKGQIDDAMAVVEEGLTRSPESKALNTRLAELQKAGAKTRPHKQELSQKPDLPPDPSQQDSPPPPPPPPPRDPAVAN